MKAIVDAELCIGCELCAQVAPEVYRMEEEKAVALSDDLTEEQTASAKEGAEQCPVDAIKVS